MIKELFANADEAGLIGIVVSVGLCVAVSIGGLVDAGMEVIASVGVSVRKAVGGAVPLLISSLLPG